MKKMKRILALMLSLMICSSFNVPILAEDTISEFYEIAIRPENYASIVFDIPGYGSHPNNNSIEAHYNTLYSKDNWLLAEYTSVIAGYNVPIKNALESMNMNWYIRPAQLTSSRVIPIFYDLNRFDLGIEEGIYNGKTTEEPGYTAIKNYALTYWPASGYSSSNKNVAANFSEDNGVKTYNIDITSSVMSKYVTEDCTSEYLTLATGRETSKYSNSNYHLNTEERLPSLTVKYRVSDILNYINSATEETIAKVIDDLGAINVFANSEKSYDEFKALSDDFKVAVGKTILSNKPDGGFTSLSEIITAFDSSMNLENIFLSMINEATEANIASVIINLGENGVFDETSIGYEEYMNLGENLKKKINSDFLSKRPETGFITLNDVAVAYDEALDFGERQITISPTNYANVLLNTEAAHHNSKDNVSEATKYAYVNSSTIEKPMYNYTFVTEFYVPATNALSEMVYNGSLYREGNTGTAISIKYITSEIKTESTDDMPTFTSGTYQGSYTKTVETGETDAEGKPVTETEEVISETDAEYQKWYNYAKQFWTSSVPAAGSVNVSESFNIDISATAMNSLKNSGSSSITFGTSRSGFYGRYNYKVVPKLILKYKDLGILNYANTITEENSAEVIKALGTLGVLDSENATYDEYKVFDKSFQKVVNAAMASAKPEGGYSNFEDIASDFANAMVFDTFTTEISNTNYAVVYTTLTKANYGYGSYHDNSIRKNTSASIVKTYINTWEMKDFHGSRYANLNTTKTLAEFYIPMKKALTNLTLDYGTVYREQVASPDIRGFYVAFNPSPIQLDTTTAVYSGVDETYADYPKMKEWYDYAQSSAWKSACGEVEKDFSNVDITNKTLVAFKNSDSDFLVTRTGDHSLYDGWCLTQVPTMKLTFMTLAVLDYINDNTIDAKEKIYALGESGILDRGVYGFDGYTALNADSQSAVETELTEKVSAGGFDDFVGFITEYDNIIGRQIDNSISSADVIIDFDESDVTNKGTNSAVIPSLIGTPEFVTSFDGTKALSITNTFGKEAQNYLDVGKYKFGEDSFSIVFWMKAPDGGIGEFAYGADGSGHVALNPVDFGANHTMGGVVLSNKDFATNGTDGFAMTAMPSKLFFGVNMKLSGGNALNTNGIMTGTDSRWHQIAYIVDREGYATTYIDGVEAASFKISEVEGTIDGTDAANLIFGADGFGQYGMNFGEFDDIRIYRNPLSKKIIEEMYYQKLLSGVNYEAQRTLSTDAGAVYSEENKAELSEELAKSKEYAENYVMGDFETLLDKYTSFNEYYNTFLNKDSKGAAMFTSDIHITGRGVDSGRGLFIVKSMNDHEKLGVNLKTWITAGDYAETGNNNQHQFFDILDSNVPDGLNVVVSRGNHDEPANGSRTDAEGNKISLTRDELREEFQDRMDKYFDSSDGINKKLLSNDGTLNEPYYYLNDGAAHYINLDCYDTVQTRWISPEQFVWLEETLNQISGDGKPIFIIEHLPIQGTVSNSGSDVYNFQEPYSTELKNLLNKYENDNIFLLNGHHHTGFGNSTRNAVANLGNFWQINSASMGKSSTTGYADIGTAYYINVYDDRVVFRARDFRNDEWLREYDMTFDLKPATKTAMQRIEISDSENIYENIADATGKAVNISVPVDFVSDSGEFKAILAEYAGNKLISAKTTTVSADEENISFDTTLSSDVTEIKIMILNSMAYMKPICYSRTRQ